MKKTTLFNEMTDPVNQLLALNREATAIKEKVALYEQEIKELKATQNKIEMDLMPALMDELGISEFLLQDGTKIKLTEITTGRLTDDTRQSALAWLRDNGHAAIIKNQIVTQLPVGADDKVGAIIDFYFQLGIDTVEHKEDVHYQTLQAFLREVAHTADFPRDLFKVHEVKKVVVK